jgi:uncharacterized damage-inducible protein DinB
MRKAIVLVAAMWIAGAGMAQAQMGGGMPGPAVGSQATPAKAADGNLMMLEGEFMAAAKAMPADKFNFSPASLTIPGDKFDGVRTFGEQLKHVAQANYFFASTITGMKPDADVKAIDGLKGKEEIVAALAGSFAALHKANATLTAQNSFEVVDFEGAKATRFTVSAFAVAHGFDHYGQMVEYLRMNGIVPPASAK